MARSTGGVGSGLGAGFGVRSDEDGLIVMAVLGAILLTVLGSAGLYWARASAWLVEHKVLVAAPAHPWLALPGGAGLDVPRVVLAACLVVALLAIAVSTVHHRRQDRPLGSPE